MPRRRTKAEQARVSRGKDGHDNHSTARELAATLGVDESTVKRQARTGAIPEPDLISSSGWALWSPATVQRIIHNRTHRGAK